VVDHHVDRPGVEVGRPMKLTGTNRPIGLILLPQLPASAGGLLIDTRTTGLFRVHRTAAADVALSDASLVEATAARCLQSVYCRPYRPFDRERLPALAGRLDELVVLPGGPHPIPFRTRSLSPPGPMVLRLKARESRSPPALLTVVQQHTYAHTKPQIPKTLPQHNQHPRGVEQPGSSSGS
jgi:hypothetical protein